MHLNSTPPGPPPFSVHAQSVFRWIGLFILWSVFRQLIHHLMLQEKSVFLTGILFTGPVFFVTSILSTLAISYGAMAAVPFGTIIVMLLIYSFSTIPLLALGGILGHRYSPRNSVPYSKRCFREIPPLNWYGKIHSQMFLGGLLPFSGILVELHLFYASLWSHKLFTLPSILFITFTILVLLTIVLSIGLTYIQLSMEDSQWCWRYALVKIFITGHYLYDVQEQPVG